MTSSRSWNRRLVTMAAVAPMALGAMAVGSTIPAHAAAGCLYGARITSPTNGAEITLGRSVQVRAVVSNALSAALNVTGPQSWPKLDSGGNLFGEKDLEGDITPTKPGTYTVSVSGNVTGCSDAVAFRTFTVSKSAATPSPSKSSHSGGSTSHKKSNKTGSTPKGSTSGGSHHGDEVPNTPSGLGSGDDDPYPDLKPLNGGSLFNLPSVAPDGSYPGFEYPTPQPEVASPSASTGQQPQAENAAATSELKWGRTIAIALILLLLSAHLSMWTRRLRTSAMAADARRTPGGRAGASSRTTGTRTAHSKKMTARGPRASGARAGEPKSGSERPGRHARRDRRRG